MFNINTLLLRYKNFIAFAAIAFIAFFATSKFHAFSSHRIRNRVKTIKEVKQKIGLAQKIRFREREIVQLKGTFLENDSFAFMNRVSDRIKKGGLTTVSLKPAQKPPQAFGSGPDGIIKPFALQMVVLGDFPALLKFLEEMDRSKLNMFVSSMKMKSTPDGIRADIEVVGQALKD